ncbi:MAG: hypothetical protein HYU86_01290 [Chloroflexi bacterium]|nr:hypothetical protein [Chloroflexota bacterium]
MSLFGWLGFALFQVFWFPQLAKTLRTKDVSGLSLSAWIILWVGLLFYLIYSVSIGDVIFTLGNGTGLIQASVQLGLIWKYSKR